MGKRVTLTDEAYDYVIEVVGQKLIEFADQGQEDMELALTKVIEQLDEAVDVDNEG